MVGKNEDLGRATKVLMMGLSLHAHLETSRIVFV